jgi:hypothetical protein
VEWLRVKALNSSPSTTEEKKKKVKWTAGVSQVIEHLLCKCETLIQIPVPTKKRKTKEKK